jgi:hypothetical protein
MSTETTFEERSPRASKRAAATKRLSIGVGLLIAIAGGPLRADATESHRGSICRADDAQNFVSGFAPGPVTTDETDGSVTFAAPRSWMSCEIDAVPPDARHGDFSIEVELAGNPQVKDCRLIIVGPAENLFFTSIALAPGDEPGRHAGCDRSFGLFLREPGARRFVHCMADGGTRIESVKVTYGTNFDVCDAVR